MGSVLDSNDRDTILHALIDPAYSGPVRIKVVVEDDRGYQDSIYYNFDYYGTTYEPLTVDTLSVCVGSPADIEVSMPAVGLSYLWSNGDTTSQTTFQTAGTAWVLVDVGLCFFTDTLVLINGSLVTPISDTAYCDSAFISFDDPVVQSVYWQSLNTNSTSLWLDSTAAYPYIATDINGCELVDTLNFRIIPEPEVDQGFSCPDFTLNATGYTAFIALEVGGNRYVEPSLDTTFSFAGTHEIVLVAIDSCGNLDTIRSELVVDCLDDIMLYVPNAFTPNNDGRNDAFCISSSLPERTRYAVYDRWGNELFEGRADECWDPVGLGQELGMGTFTVRTFTRLLSDKLHIHQYTVTALR
jgi:gliding motility-associated-like protein